MIAFLLAACSTPPRSSPAAEPAAGAPQQPPRRTHIEIIGGESTETFWLFGARDSTQTHFVDTGLTSTNATNLELFPVLVEEVPSFDKGTWTIDDATGRMRVTFRLRPNLRWHDGAPFTSADFKFGWEVAVDPKVPIAERNTVSLVDSIDTPDERTIVINWNAPFRFGAGFQKQDMRQLPRHLMEPVYRDALRTDDYTQLLNHAHFSREFVGLGPYKLSNFADPTDWSMDAFDGFALGRPKIDTIRYRVVEDENAVLTSFLADAVHVSFAAGGIQAALTLKEQWESAGRGKVNITPLSSTYVHPSLNPWLQDANVRKALLHAIDRQEINTILYGGYSQIMHMPLNPYDPRFSQADQVATKYPFDLSRAQQLLETAGWRRGADGILVNAQNQRFSIEYRAQTGSGPQAREQAVIIDAWKQVGVDTQIANLSSSAQRDTAARGRWPGVARGGGNVSVAEWEERWHSRSIPTEEKRWLGDNVSRYSSPRADALIDELNSARTTRARQDEIVVEFMRQWTADLPTFPLVFNVDILPVKKGLVGPVPRIISGSHGVQNWNIFEWTLTE
jgi:peptide/nickel transport system substrate-binding protein